jgi:hypothetical protein
MSMTRKFNSSLLLWLCASTFFLSAVAAHSESGDMKLHAQLIWGTNEPKSPDPKHKLVGKELEKKLKNSPFKWEYYFEVSDEKFNLPLQKEKTVTMSRDCAIVVRNLGGSVVEFRLLGKGKLVNKITQPLPKGQILVEGGNADNATAWFVVLKSID